MAGHNSISLDMLLMNYVGPIAIVGCFLFLYGIFKLFGGDKKQAGRSEWYPLWYLIPGMILIALTFYFLSK